MFDLQGDYIISFGKNINIGLIGHFGLLFGHKNSPFWRHPLPILPKSDIIWL